MSFAVEDVGRFLRSFHDAQRAQLDVDFVEGVHSVMPEKNTFKYQPKLPQLPVPPLADTITRYLRSLQPIQTDPAAYARSELAAKTFLDSPCAAMLQQALEARARKCVEEKRGFPNTHWLEEWWEYLAYLSSREPLAINLNCFGTLFRGVSVDFGPRTDTNLLALTRAAAVIYGTMQFRHALLAHNLGPEALDRRGNTPLCMAQFNRVFSSVREPGAEMDKITQHDVDSDRTVPPHAAVWCEGRWYRMPLVRGDQRANAVAALSTSGVSSSSLAVFTAYLRSLIALQQDARQRRASGPEDEEVPVTVLTSAERAFWAAARDELRGSSDAAASALRTVESAVFHVVLSSERPATDQERMNLCCHGGGGADLWMDKSLTCVSTVTWFQPTTHPPTHPHARTHARTQKHKQHNHARIMYARGSLALRPFRVAPPPFLHRRARAQTGSWSSRTARWASTWSTRTRTRPSTRASSSTCGWQSPRTSAAPPLLTPPQEAWGAAGSPPPPPAPTRWLCRRRPAWTGAWGRGHRRPARALLRSCRRRRRRPRRTSPSTAWTWSPRPRCPAAA